MYQIIIIGNFLWQRKSETIKLPFSSTRYVIRNITAGFYNFQLKPHTTILKTPNVYFIHISGTSQLPVGLSGSILDTSWAFEKVVELWRAWNIFFRMYSSAKKPPDRVWRVKKLSLFLGVGYYNNGHKTPRLGIFLPYICLVVFYIYL